MMSSIETIANAVSNALWSMWMCRHWQSDKDVTDAGTSNRVAALVEALAADQRSNLLLHDLAEGVLLQQIHVSHQHFALEPGTD